MIYTVKLTTEYGGGMAIIVALCRRDVLDFVARTPMLGCTWEVYSIKETKDVAYTGTNTLRTPVVLAFEGYYE